MDTADIETPLTKRKAVRRGPMGQTVPATVGTATSAPAVRDLEAELAHLRLLIRRQEEVVERLLGEHAVSDGDRRVTVKEGVPTAKSAKRSTRRGLLTQLAAGAAGVAVAAVYGTTKAETASAETFGTIVGPSNSQAGILAYPNGVSAITSAQTSAIGGAWGQLDNNPPSPATSAGVIGIANNGAGVLGQSGTNYGVMGITSAPNSFSSFAGVSGTASNGSGYGVYGIGGPSGGTGVGGSSGSGSGGRGVFGGAGGDGAGTGVFGRSTGGAGVHGESTSGAGVHGQSVSQPGVDGTSTNSLGIRGTSTNFVGIVGISTTSHGLYGSTNGGAGVYGIVAENNGANGPGLLVTGATPSQIFGGLQVFGVKNAVLKMQDGSFASVYCQESPEPYFEDFGRAQLVGGVANVPLEREFAQLVAGGDYMVFPVAEGLSGGLYVSRRGPTSFEVRDPSNGSLPFSYRIVTKRKDIEGRRFARVSIEAAQKVAGARAMLAGMATAGSPSPIQPGVPAPAPVVTVGPGAIVQRPGTAP